MQPIKRSPLAQSDEQLIIKSLENLDSDLTNAVQQLFSAHITARILLLHLDRFRGDPETHREVLRQAKSLLKETEYDLSISSQELSTSTSRESISLQGDLNFSGRKRQYPNTEISSPQKMPRTNSNTSQTPQERYNTPPRSYRQPQCDLSPDSLDWLRKTLGAEPGS